MQTVRWVSVMNVPDPPMRTGSPGETDDARGRPGSPEGRAETNREWAREVRTRLASLQLSPARENEVVEELSQHLEDRWRELVAGGASPEEAERSALAEFSDGEALAQHMAPLRQAHPPPAVTSGAPAGSVIAGFVQDLRCASRRLRKQPGFAATAVLTLALGIGAATAIFSVVYGVLLKPLPFHDAERLVAVWHRAPGLKIPLLEQGAATYFTYRDNGRAFEDIALWDSYEVSITGGGEPERARALWVTDGLLPILRVEPTLGRSFTRDDDSPGSPRRAILTHGYWERRFGGAPDVIGRSLTINGRVCEVIGVLPRGFTFLHADPAVLLPLQLNEAETRVGDFSYRGIARLKPGVTLDQANADIARMLPLALERFAPWPGLTPRMFEEAQLGPNVRPLAHDVIGDAGRLLWTLAGTVAIVLLIACANVANLFLVKAEGRRQEFAVRAALGASRYRLGREVLSESIGLGLAGGAIGLLLAWAGIKVLVRLAPAGLPRLEDIGIDSLVLMFTVVVSVITGLVFGLIPVMRLRSPAVAALNGGGRSASDVFERHRTRNALVVSEIALALVLLIVSGLMIRTFVALHQVDPGFVRPEEVQTFRVSVPDALIADPHQVVVLYEQIARRLEELPGVASAGLSSSVTMDRNTASTPIIVEDFPDARRELAPIRRHKRAAPGYFETMGNRVVAGRAFTWTDIREARPVVVISENLAREYWKNPADAVGRRITQSLENPWREIVGVVGNEHDDGLHQPPTAIVYWPILIKEWWSSPLDVGRTMSFVVRSIRVGSPGFVRELQQAVWAVNPHLPLGSVRTLDEIRAGWMAQTAFALVMLAIASTVALFLGLVGIYGVVAYIATERTREIGIRMALGAQTRDVRRLFLRHGLLLTGAGIALGTGAALALVRTMSGLLFGVSPVDPLTYITVAATLGTVALLATYLPARRASRVDPMIALRTEA